MGLQLLHLFFVLNPTEAQLADYEKSLIADIRAEFVEKLSLAEVPVAGKLQNRPDWKIVYAAKKTEADGDTRKPPTWIELWMNIKDRYYELNAHIRDGTPEQYPRYSRIMYEESPTLRLDPIQYDREICPITAYLSYDMGNEEHQRFFATVEDLIRYSYKIQFFFLEGKKETRHIDQISLAYLSPGKPTKEPSVPREGTVEWLEQELEGLTDINSQLSSSVSRLYTIKNHMTLDMRNITSIHSVLQKNFGQTVDIRYIENKINEIDFKAQDSQIFLELIRDKKDILLGKVKVEENKKLINYNRDLLKIHQDAQVVESAAVIITFITLFQVLIQCVSSVIPRYIETSIIFKVGIPFFISVGVISLVEGIKIIRMIRQENGNEKSLVEILSGESRAIILTLTVVVPLLCLVVIVAIWSIFVGESIPL